MIGNIIGIGKRSFSWASYWILQDIFDVLWWRSAPIDSLDTIGDTPTLNDIWLRIWYSNTGDQGSDTASWELYDSGDSLVDSGNQTDTYLIEGGFMDITGVNYGVAGSGYYLKVKMSAEVSWTTSNTFNIVTP